MKVFWGAPAWHLSGANTLGLLVARELRARGHDARILVTREPRGSASEDGLPVERLPVDDSMAWPARWRLLVEWLEAQAPCLWIPNYDFLNFSVIPALPPEVRVACVCHADEPLYFRNLAPAAPYVDAMVGVSTHLGRRVRGLVGPERSRTIFTAACPGPQRTTYNTEAPLRIIYAGRLDERQKRVGALVRIATAARDLRVPYRLLLAGDGPEEARLRAGFQREGLAQGVSFAGRCGPDETRQHYRNADLFLLPSAYEGLSMSLLEAMAEGCVPVISNTRSGARDAVQDGVNGCLCPIGDAMAFARQIARLHDDRATLVRMGRQAQATIPGRFDTHVLGDAWGQLVDWVDRRPPARRTGRIRPHPDLSLRHQLACRLENRVRRIFRGKDLDARRA